MLLLLNCSERASDEVKMYGLNRGQIPFQWRRFSACSEQIKARDEYTFSSTCSKLLIEIIALLNRRCLCKYKCLQGPDVQKKNYRKYERAYHQKFSMNLS